MKYINLHDYQVAAQGKLTNKYYDYFAGGAQDEITLNSNNSAFSNIKIRPRVLCGKFDGTLETRILDSLIDIPVIIAPTAFHCLAHPEGEKATAQAAQQAGTLMIISMAATTCLEDIISSAVTDKPQSFWFQLYIQSDRVFTAELVQRAEAAGCSAIVITVDSPTFGRRERDMRHQFFDLPNNMHCENLKLRNSNRYREIEFDAALCWKDIDWLRSVTKLPIAIKGIMHPDDAKIAISHGVNALIVSNHGGRQLDSVAASIELLPDIAEVIKGDIPIIVDGGIRRGTDIVKALALGANAVAIGRPIIWGLAVAGQAGVTEILNIIKQDLLHALTLCGCQSLDTLTSEILFSDPAHQS